MKKQELDGCLKKLKLSKAQLGKIIGRDPDCLDAMGDRCVRALVLKEDIREIVLRARLHFPEATLVAVRSIDDAS